MIKISAVIITYNEEKNIARCLASLQKVADDIVVVDSFSSDRTEELVKAAGARFVAHAFDGHIQQKNWAISQAKYPHVLSLDADEALDPDLEAAILAIKENLNSTNNQSCILKISTPTQAVLLVGDIEQKGEKYLVEHYGDKLKAQALVVAHHGSQTSSSAFFIDKVKPVWAFISAGIDNRYHFPHKKTLMTLTQAQAQILSTQECGMIHFSLNHTKKIAKPACFYDINK